MIAVLFNVDQELPLDLARAKCAESVCPWIGPIEKVGLVCCPL